MFTVIFDIKDNILHAKVAGLVQSYEQAAQKAEMVVDKALETGVLRVLLDERNLFINIDALDISLVAEKLDRRCIQQYGGRTACLCRPDYAAIYKMYETFYKNRSLSYRVFQDGDLALEWLKA